MPLQNTYYVSQESGLQPARKWVTNEGKTVHPAFGTSSNFNDQRAEFTVKRRSNDGVLRSHTDHFVQVMELYQKHAKEKPIANFNIRSTHSWDEVIRVAKDAEESYINDGKGFKGAARMIVRSAGDYNAAINPWLNLIPEKGEYTSVICGGLKLMFGAASQMSERRKQIFDAFGKVPETVEMAQRYHETFPSDKRLYDLTTELYLAILTTIEAMTIWLVDKSILKSLKVLVLGPLSDRPLDEVIKIVDNQTVILRGQIDYLRDSVIAKIGAATERMEPKIDNIEKTTTSIKTDTGQTKLSVMVLESEVSNVGLNVESVKSEVSTLSENTHNMQVDVSTIADNTENMNSQVSTIADNTESMKIEVSTIANNTGSMNSQVSTIADKTEKMDSHVAVLADNANNLKVSYDQHATSIEAGIDNLQNGVQAQNGLLHVLHEHYRKAEWNQKKLRYAENEIMNLKLELERARTPTNLPKLLVSRAQLIELLTINPATAAHDNQTITRRGQSMQSSSQMRAQWLMRCSLFQIWLTSGKAQVLLVDGNASAEAMERISSMSICCAMLVNSLTEIEPAVSIHFFCGLHTASNDPLSGPSGLVRSLITQLLSTSFTFDLSFIKSRKQRDQISRHELDHLCELFRKLVKQLPIDTVLFCMIDGISLYERYEWQQNTCFVVRKLRELAEDDELDAVMKLMVTSPCMSRYVKEQIAAEDRLMVPRDAGTDKQEFTHRQAMTHTKQTIEGRGPSPGRWDDEDEGYEDVDFDDGNVSD